MSPDWKARQFVLSLLQLSHLSPLACNHDMGETLSHICLWEMEYSTLASSVLLQIWSSTNSSSIAVIDRGNSQAWTVSCKSFFLTKLAWECILIDSEDYECGLALCTSCHHELQQNTIQCRLTKVVGCNQIVDNLVSCLLPSWIDCIQELDHQEGCGLHLYKAFVCMVCHASQSPDSDKFNFSKAKTCITYTWHHINKRH